MTTHGVTTSRDVVMSCVVIPHRFPVTGSRLSKSRCAPYVRPSRNSLNRSPNDHHASPRVPRPRSLGRVPRRSGFRREGHDQEEEDRPRHRSSDPPHAERHLHHRRGHVALARRLARRADDRLRAARRHLHDPDRGGKATRITSGRRSTRSRTTRPTASRSCSSAIAAAREPVDRGRRRHAVRVRSRRTTTLSTSRPAFTPDGKYVVVSRDKAGILGSMYDLVMRQQRRRHRPAAHGSRAPAPRVQPGRRTRAHRRRTLFLGAAGRAGRPVHLRDAQSAAAQVQPDVTALADRRVRSRDRPSYHEDERASAAACGPS